VVDIFAFNSELSSVGLIFLDFIINLSVNCAGFLSHVGSSLDYGVASMMASIPACVENTATSAVSRCSLDAEALLIASCHCVPTQRVIVLQECTCIALEQKKLTWGIMRALGLQSVV